MGADLYIESISDALKAEWSGVRDDAIKRRDLARDVGDNNLAETIQKEVDEACKKRDAAGYFRDSYNSTSLFWQFGLSWWDDIGEQLTDEGYLPVERAVDLRARIKTGVLPELPERWPKQHHCKGTAQEWQEYFVEKRQAFVAFLDQAIALNEPIYCSI